MVSLRLYDVLNAVKGAPSVWNDNQTHTRVRLMKKNLKIMNLTYFHPEEKRNVENKNNMSSQHQTCR